MAKRLLLDHAVAGIHYHEFVGGGLPLKEGEPISLVREPTNPHDRFAVKLVVRGRHLGYIPYAFSMLVTELIKASYELDFAVTATVADPVSPTRDLVHFNLWIHEA